MTDSPSDEFVFGEVQSVADSQLATSPKDNGHWAVCPVIYRPSSRTLPTEVFLDLDTMLDMQEHAAEDTSVELGGILLGRRGVHKDGTPFVEICDALRARHYRATRGSFTFTHETWVDLQRQRNELPQETEVVGWYHTHPGWSVFLSDMDVFICDHFFAHPDDVALVIDPTSGDTGLFVRRNTPPQQPPSRLDSYSLYSHRKRTEDLTQWASYFSGAPNMNPSPAVFPGRGAAPVVIASPNDGSANSRVAIMWLMAAVICGQFALMTALILNSLNPAVSPIVDTKPNDLITREKVVDSMLKTLATTGPESAIDNYRQTQLDNAELRATHLGLMAHIQSLEQAQQQASSLEKRTELELASVRKKLEETQAKLGATKKAAADSSTSPDASDPNKKYWYHLDWPAFGLGGGIGLLLSAIGAVLWTKLNTTEKDDSLNHSATNS